MCQLTKDKTGVDVDQLKYDITSSTILAQALLGDFRLDFFLVFLLLNVRLEEHFWELYRLKAVSLTVPDLFWYRLDIGSALERAHSRFS